MANETTRASLTRALEALEATQRRCILYYLREHETASVDTLADLVTGWLYASVDGVGTPEQRQQTFVELHHVHLPKLAATGLIDYGEAAGRVELLEYAPFVDDLLDLTLDVESETPDAFASEPPWIGDDPGPE